MPNRHGNGSICVNCLKPFHLKRTCCKADQSSRQYSSVMFVTAKIAGKNEAQESGEAKADCLGDRGAQVAAIDADAHAEATIK